MTSIDARRELLRAVSHPLAGCTLGVVLALPMLAIAAALPQGLEQVAFAASGVLLMVAALLGLALLALGRAVGLDRRAQEVVSAGRDRILFPGSAAPQAHWVRPRTRQAEPSPEAEQDSTIDLRSAEEVLATKP